MRTFRVASDYKLFVHSAGNPGTLLGQSESANDQSQDLPAANKGMEQERTYTSNGGKITFGTWSSKEIKIRDKIVKNASTT